MCHCKRKWQSRLGKKSNPEWRRMNVTFEYSVIRGSRNDESTYCSSQHPCSINHKDKTMGMWVSGRIDGENANRDIIWSNYPVSKNDIAKDATAWSHSTSVNPKQQ
jgi:hypothetical protein